MNMLTWRRPPKLSEPPARRRVRELEIITARLIRAGFAGEYHAAFHGRGIEFAQVREYQPGDDIRTIDWNVTARSGIPHVKQFVEERDLTVLIALDVSPSMVFGSLDRRKSEIAAELTAVLSFAALQNRDRVGLAIFSDQVRTFIPPRRGRIHAERIVQAAITAPRDAGGPTRLDRVVEFIDRVSVKRAVVIVLSDFLDVDFDKPLNRLNRRHDVVALVIGDPREERFPERGLVELVDSETGRRSVVDLRGRRDLRKRDLAERFRRIGVDGVALSTAIPYEQTLLRFFRERMVRRV